MEEAPAAVSVRTKQAGEIRDRWSWVEPSVWTERMLTALEVGVKGGKWFSLIDKVSSERSLRSSFQQVKRNRGSAGVDRVTIKMFEAHLPARSRDQPSSVQYLPGPTGSSDGAEAL